MKRLKYTKWKTNNKKCDHISPDNLIFLKNKFTQLHFVQCTRTFFVLSRYPCLLFQSTILYCEAKRDENIAQFTKALDELIGTVRRELVTIKNKVCSPALLDADNIPQVATEKLKLLKEDLAKLSTKARNYATYQERFGSSMSSSQQKQALTE